MPQQLSHGINITYADDVTQIITQPGRSRNMLAKKIEREAKLVSDYENKWKIKTNTSKFTLLPIAMKKTAPVTLNNNNIEYNKQAKILGLNITIHGYNKHINEIKKKATLALSIIRRFYLLQPTIKLHLVKACVLPILTYPAYPLNSISKSALLKLQKNTK